MTDVNALIPANASLYPFMALGINSVGEIVGVAFQKATGESHAYLATPCDDEHANEKGCEDQGVSSAQDETRQSQKIVVPENIRKLLRGRLSLRSHIPVP